MGKRCSVCSGGWVSERALARGTKKWVSTRSLLSGYSFLLVSRPDDAWFNQSRQSSVGVAVAVNSRSEAARALQVGISVGPAASNNRLKLAARGRSGAEALQRTRAAA